MAVSLYQMVDYLKYKEKYYFTVFSVCLKKGAVLEELQKNIDFICKDYSTKFIEENKEKFENDEFRFEFLKALRQCGSPTDTGRRLLNQIYEDLLNFPQQENEQPEIV